MLRRTDADGHDETFVRLGVTWLALTGDDAKRERTSDHIAFRVAPDAIRSIVDKLKAKGYEFILSKPKHRSTSSTSTTTSSSLTAPVRSRNSTGWPRLQAGNFRIIGRSGEI